MNKISGNMMDALQDHYRIFLSVSIIQNIHTLENNL